MPAAFIPTKEQSIAVSVMAACGVPQADIARQLAKPGGKAIDLKTLRKAFRRELDEGMRTANSLVARALFKKATGDGPQSVTAAIFWLKTRAGWKETNTTELVGPDGAALRGTTILAGMTAEQVAEAVQAALAKV